MNKSLTHFLIFSLVILLIVACASTPPEPPQPVVVEEVSSPTATATATPLPPPPATPTTTSTPIPASPTPAAGASTGELLKPYPYTTPLPPPLPTELDGIYTHTVEFTGTPTPCRRCAPYRAEGGTWTLNLKEGVFRVSHDGTTFTGLGSFTLSDNQLNLFNDPNCHLNVGIYTWTLDGRSLHLQEVSDPCAFGLRAKNLTAGVWLSQEAGQPLDPCQPPSLEAAISGHWPTPPGC